MMRLIEQLPIAYNLVLYLLNLIFFILPGFAITLIIAARREVRVVHAVMLTVLVSAGIGYLSFWIYLANKLCGQIFSFGSLALSAVTIAVLLMRRTQLKMVARNMAEPFLYVFAVGIFYVCFLSLFGNGHWQFGAGLAEQRFFSQLRPIDDQLPLLFAQRIYDHGPITPLWSDWLSSDRPPLQAGIFLLQKPFGLLGNMGIHYELLGTVLQCMWICGVWTLMKSVGASKHRTKQVLGFLVFSGFIFYNSVYVWPKLLAGAFLLFFASILFDVLRRNRPITFFETALAAGSLSLAMLGHPGSIFTLPAFAVILIRNRRLLPVRQCILGAILMALFGVPWMAYQKFYDPPGNRLLKMHLAGAVEVDSRSAWQALKDAYSDRDAGTYLRYKWENIATLIGPKPLDGFGLSEASRIAQREYIWSAIGVVNVGWVAAVLVLFRRRQAALQFSGTLVLIAVTNLIVWSIALFGPALTVTTHGSYGDILLLEIGLLGYLLVLPRMVLGALFAIQALNLGIVWMWSPPLHLENATLQMPLLIVAICLGLGLAWHFGRSYLEREPADQLPGF